jgi:hypothetical protein
MQSDTTVLGLEEPMQATTISDNEHHHGKEKTKKTRKMKYPKVYNFTRTNCASHCDEIV